MAKYFARVSGLTIRITLIESIVLHNVSSCLHCLLPQLLAVLISSPE